MKRRLVESNAKRLAAIETGEQIVVGVNKFTEAEPSPLATGEESIITVDPRAEQEQIASLKAWRASRDAAKVKAALAALAAAAKEGRNIMEPSIACAHAGVTTGEWSGALREIFGEFRAPTGVSQAVVVGRHRRPEDGARPGRDAHRQARPADQDAGRQARSRRPLQRRRADRAARPRRRLRGGLRGHPADARADRRRRAGGGRARRRPVDPVRLARAAGHRDHGADAGGRPRPTSRSSSAASSRPRTPRSWSRSASPASTRPRTSTSTPSWPTS